MNYSFPWVNQSLTGDFLLPGEKKSGAARYTGFWALVLGPAKHQHLVTPAQAALRCLDKHGAGLFQTHSAGALSRVLLSPQQSSWSALHFVFSLHCILYFPTLLHVFQCNFRLHQRGTSSEPPAVMILQVMDLFFHGCGKLSCTPSKIA